MTLTLDEAVAATGAMVRNAAVFPKKAQIVTDSRTIRPGETYLALRGEHFDGHHYIAHALEQGAAGIITEDASTTPEHVAALIVQDTKRAYMQLAAAARDRFAGEIVAITGSTGKTTTKFLLQQLLNAHFKGRVAASPANENNEIGVSKLFLTLDPDAPVVIVEMGARHKGDILPLVEIARPQFGVLTNIGEAHLEIMGSRENLHATKWELFALGARAILNVHDKVSVERAAGLSHEPLWFGVGKSNERGAFVLDRSHLRVRLERSYGEYAMDARIPGDHNLSNLAAAICAALALDLPLEAIIAAIPDLQLPSGRYETIRIDGRPRIVFDAYNASLAGMLATLDAFATESGVQRIAVLASMAELGEQSAAMHEQVGERAAANRIDRLLVGGEFADELAKGARRGGLASDRVVRYAGNADAVQWLRSHAGSDDVVLLKGSRVYKLEEIVEGLRV
ncbi:MAG: UDP-N-acetylmuramoyl-tripeptide--D-alanyl-D-alanine ligase [Candidatus Eremiobacteraeota bacterium]|nr:UDP-N-acetylmuramoyl-tripeptide--D-alanyl-D-alanine ligase [Candidatus Eremiobacteraeota bacterium]